MSDAATLRTSIDKLTDEQAVRALMIVIDHEHLTETVASWDGAELQLREASTDPELAVYAPTEAGNASVGELARAALAHAATISESLEDVISRAVDFVTGPAERFEPATLAIGAAAIVLLKTEIKVERNARGKWSFLLHKHPTRDSTLGHVVTTLISYFKGHGNG